jgi:uncharacterized protein
MLGIAPTDIAFDFDGVIADTFRLFVRMANQDYGLQIDYEDITDYDFLNVIDIDRQIVARLLQTITEIPQDLDLKPNKGAPQTLARLSVASPLLLITARPSGQPVERWFEKTMPNLVRSLNIEATGESTAKLPVLKARKVRYFVEDRLDTCHLIASQGITPIVYEQPWNRQAHPFQVVRDWDDIAGLIAW